MQAQRWMETETCKQGCRRRGRWRQRHTRRNASTHLGHDRLVCTVVLREHVIPSRQNTPRTGEQVEVSEAWCLCVSHTQVPSSAGCCDKLDRLLVSTEGVQSSFTLASMQRPKGSNIMAGRSLCMGSLAAQLLSSVCDTRCLSYDMWGTFTVLACLHHGLYMPI